MTNFHLYNLLQHTTVVVIFLKTKKHGQETPFPNFLCGCFLNFKFLLQMFSDCILLKYIFKACKYFPPF